MKRSPYLLQLDNPCPESWEGMHPTATGRFCDTCAKNVVDFTSLTDDQILAQLKKSDKTYCGRVTETQLNRYLVSRTETTLTARFLKLVAGLFLFAIPDSIAQELIERKPTPLLQLPRESERIAADQANDPAFSQKTKVRAQLIAAETQQPVPDAYISLMPPPINGTSRGGPSVRSDAEGYFEILVPDSLVGAPTRLTIVHADYGLKRVPLLAGAYPERIELLPPPPPVVIKGGGLVVVKRKWWQFWGRKKELCTG